MFNRGLEIKSFLDSLEFCGIWEKKNNLLRYSICLKKSFFGILVLGIAVFLSGHFSANQHTYNHYFILILVRGRQTFRIFMVVHKYGVFNPRFWTENAHKTAQHKKTRLALDDVAQLK